MAGGTQLGVVSSVTFELTIVGLDPLRANICAAGELDLAARDALTEVLDRQEGVRRPFVHLNMSRVTLMDCSCLGVLLASHQRLRARDGLLIISGVTHLVARVLALSGHDHLLFVVPAFHDPLDGTSLG